MELYALKVRKSDLTFLTLLNDGVAPVVEKKTTYLVFDATPGSPVPNRIMTQQELKSTYPLSKLSPSLLKIEE